MAPAISDSEGVQFPKHGHLSTESSKILNEKNLAGYRKEQGRKEQGATDTNNRLSRAPAPQSVSQRAQQLMQASPAKRPGVIAKTKQAARDMVDNLQDPQGSFNAMASIWA